MVANRTASRIYDSREIPPRQRHFPARKRTVKPLMAPANGDASHTRTERQDTMTQYFPRISSSQSDSENVMERTQQLQEQHQGSNMEESDYEQEMFGRKRRRITRNTHNSGSKRQETLTQLPNFLLRRDLASGEEEYLSDRAEEFETEDDKWPPSPSPRRICTPAKANVKFEVPSSQSPAASPLTYLRSANIASAKSAQPPRPPLQELPVRAVTHIDNSLSHRNPEKDKIKENRKDEYEKLRTSSSSFMSKCSCDGPSSTPIKREPSPEGDECETEGADDQENYDPLWGLKHCYFDDDGEGERGKEALYRKKTAIMSIIKQEPNDDGSQSASHIAPRSSQATTVASTSPTTPSSSSGRVKREGKKRPSPLRAMSLAGSRSRSASISPLPSPSPLPRQRLPPAQSPWWSPTPGCSGAKGKGKAKALLVPDSQESEFFIEQDSHYQDEEDPQILEDSQISNYYDCDDDDDGSYSPISSIQDSANILTVSQLLPDSMLIDD